MQIPKNKPIRLKGPKLKKLLMEVLERDRYICQWGECESLSYKPPIDPPHHIVYKSRGGSDTEENLITLCMYCHKKVHDKNIKIFKVNGEWVFKWRMKIKPGIHQSQIL